MKIIILYGTGNSGKSTTFRKLYEKHIKGNADFNILGAMPTESVKDYQIVVQYKGRTIAIYTWGDNEFNVKAAFQYAEENGCEVLVCAARSSGKGYQFFDKMKCPQIWIEKGRYGGKNDALRPSQEDAIREEIAELTADRIYQALQLLCE